MWSAAMAQLSRFRRPSSHALSRRALFVAGTMHGSQRRSLRADRSTERGSSRTASGRHQIASVASELLARILELRQHFEAFFCAARQHEFFVDKLQTVVRDRHQATAHAEKAADREHGIWILSIGAHEEIVDLTNGFIGVVANAGTDDFRRAIAGR